MIDNVISRPVIPLLVSFISGIALGAWIPGHAWWTYLTASLSGCFMLFCILRHTGRGVALFAPLLLFLSLGYLSLQLWIDPRFPADHIIHALDSGKWEISGRVAQNPIKDKRRHKFVLDTLTIGRDSVYSAVSGKLRITVYDPGPELYRGDQIRFKANIRSFRNFKNPGGFDYRRYMVFKRVWGASSTQGQRIVVLKRGPPSGFQKFLDKCRHRVSVLIKKTPEGQHRGVLEALIIGERSQIPYSLRDAFNRAGVGHLLAISGLHIGIVASAAFLFFSWLLSRFRILLWKAWARKGAALTAFFPILAYALLAGLSPSTQRALIMVGIFLMTFFIERDQDLLNTLALAAMVILILDPPSLFSISFQLSFVSVLSIIYGLSRIQFRGLSGNHPAKIKWRHKALYQIFIFILVSVFAVLGTLPLVMFYFNQISLIGILANLIIVPIIGFMAVPLPFAALKTITPSSLEIVCYYLGAWALLNFKSKTPVCSGLKQATDESDMRAGGQAQTIQRRSHAMDIKKAGLKTLRFLQRYRPEVLSKGDFAKRVAAVAIMVLCLDAAFWFYHRFLRDDFRVTVIDVGQGSAVLMEMPGGYCALADGGGFSDNTVFDIGARVIAPFLWRKKIMSVDTLILTHPNSDHLNGLIYIARHFNVKNAWTNHEDRNTEGYRQFVEVIAEKKITLSPFPQMPGIRDMGGVKLKILYPPKNFLEKRKIDEWRTVNNNSLVIKAIFGDTSFLIPGDIQAEAEKELVGMAGDALKSTVLVAPHHGSNSSSTGLFLDTVKPEIVAISTGWKNPFNLPHPHVLARYRVRGCRIFRTDLLGALQFTTDGNSLKVSPFFAIQRNSRSLP
jgi:competence protein ComEC